MAPVQKTEINGRGIRCADHLTPLYTQKLALTWPTGGGRSVAIVRLRTKATEFFITLLHKSSVNWPNVVYRVLESSFWKDFKLCFSIPSVAFGGFNVRTFKIYLDLLPVL